MSTEGISRNGRNPFASPDQPTLATLRAAVQAWEDLSNRARSERLSAIKTVARALELPLEAIPLHQAFLQKRLARAVPARVGIKPETWRNVRSLPQRTLTEAGFHTGSG